MDFVELKLPGVFVIENRRFQDDRGTFVKNYHEDEFAKLDLETDFREAYFSESKRGVIRGMHFQLPPDDHAKLISPVRGRFVDVVLDLRTGPTLGQSIAIDLDATAPRSVYIPKGCAHGFAAMADNSIMLYMVGTVYSPESDSGVRWDSFGFEWPFDNPVMSVRDREFTPLQEFNSPF
jgi:dTDP-4-dehydrorhamnose 3,5-epimerase/CDP-3, 6-dideoxy-D-glycero-D-glycero-4-hexulose-5-epimerase